MCPSASVVITTRNRCEELEKAVTSALAQRVDGGVEVIVMDDGSTDGTSVMVAEKFPEVKLHRFDESAGLIVRRNAGARLATSPIIFSIDDDACFSTGQIVAQTVNQFDSPIIGAVAIPYIDVSTDAAKVLQLAPGDEGDFAAPSFIGTAHALRRDLFLRLGGYRESLYHQGEESDYALRMLAAGYVVRLGRGDPIHHFESPRRDFRRVDLYGRRNNVLFGWHHAPGTFLPTYLLATSWNGFRHGLKVRRPWIMMRGLAFGYRAIGSEWNRRAPVRREVFQLYRELVRRKAVPISEVAGRLPKIAKTSAEMRSDPGSIVVAQMGARMYYAVPRILEQAGLLEILATDICASKGWPRLLRSLPSSLLPAGLRRLVGRIPQDIPSRKICAFALFGLNYALRLARARGTDERNEVYLWAGRTFGGLVTTAGFGNATGVYVFNSAGLEILQAARRCGLKGVVEQTIAPRAIERRILAEEAARFPDWELPVQESVRLDDFCAREAAEWAEADLVVCGSDFVRDGIAACGGDVAKCVVVPYGIEIGEPQRTRPARKPGPLRVLTVGAVGLRKGSPYVLAAAEALAGRGIFRIAGAVQILPAAEMKLRRQVELTGLIPRADIHAQFAWADVFLLPSLCEGSATATYEAMLCGLPVICTRETGSVVRDGEDGFIVAARDVSAISEKLIRLADNPDLLAAMSENARRNIAECSLEKYGERLLAAFRERGILVP